MTGHCKAEKTDFTDYFRQFTKQRKKIYIYSKNSSLYRGRTRIQDPDLLHIPSEISTFEREIHRETGKCDLYSQKK